DGEGWEILVSSLGPLLQSAIDLIELPLRISIETLRHEWNKQARKPLVLNETDALFVEGFYGKAVFAVEQSRYPEFSEAAPLAIGLDIDDLCLESLRSSPT